MSEVIDNRSHRIRTMKSIIERLHAGADPEEVRAELTEIVQETDASEIAAMEQELIADGMPAEKIQSMCDLHAQVLRDITHNPEETPIPPGHPVDTFKLENFAIGNRVDMLRTAVKKLAENDKEDARGDVRFHAAKLGEVDIHYSRKENLLFPYLEKRDITGPSQVMWAKDDEARALVKKLMHTADDTSAAPGAIEAAAEAAAHALEEMIYKENNILLPMAIQTLTAEEWAEIHHQSPEIGWCLVEPRKGYSPPAPAQPPVQATIPADHGIPLKTGSLKPDHLNAILLVLPFDLTFIDAEDRVAYFSHTPDSIFARNESVIGRTVQNCHPPKSVHIVNRILDDFKSGREDVAEFWIDFRGTFVHIRYFAVRDEAGTYMGTLEVTQDISSIRKLEGERRLLQYD